MLRQREGVRPLIAKKLISLLRAVVWLMPAALAVGPVTAADLVVTTDDAGLTIEHGGHVLLAPEDGLATVFMMTPETGDKACLPKPTKRTWNPTARRLEMTFPWGAVSVSYAPRGASLECRARITNTGSAAIASLELFVLPLRLSRTRANDQAVAGPLGARLTHPGGAVALVNGDADTVCKVRHHFPVKSGGLPIELQNRTPRIAKHPVVDNRWFNEEGVTIPPGATVEWTCELFFGDSEATLVKLVPGLVERYRAERPMTLTWDDRRPIGTIFWSHPFQKWPTNPRGFNFGQAAKHDVFTPAGLEVFGRELMEYVDRTIKEVKSMDGQGVIIWNLEGEEMWHPASYVGDPAKLPECAPEMNRYADEVFKRLAAAGLRTGITIRPTEYFRKAEGPFNWSQRDVKDPVETMAAKIAYAKKRWGCTLFYLDSNVFGSDFEPKLPPDANVPWVMPARMIEALHQRFPDVLIIPEWSSLDYSRWSAPYSTYHLGGKGSDPLTRLIYPASFRVVAVSPSALQDGWETFVENVRQGDVLLFPAWYAAPENRLVSLVYAEARLRQRCGPMAEWPPEKELIGLCRHAEEAERYRAALGLGRADSPEATAALAALLDDPSVLVRRQAVASLAMRKRIDDAGSVATLLNMVRGDSDPSAWVLRGVAVEAVGKARDAAVPGLLGVLADSQDAVVQQACIRALGQTQTTDDSARKALLAAITAEPRRPREVRRAAIEAIGRLRDRAAVPVLLAELDQTDRDGEFERGAAVEALGRIGDSRAVTALVAYWNRSHTTTVVYWIPDVLDAALRSITGETEICGKDAWKHWLSRNPERVPSR